MHMDSFSSGLALAVAKEDINIGASLYKELKKDEGGPSEEAVAWFKENEGKTVSINDTVMLGMVTRLNTATCGFYPGSKYPIYVKITYDDRESYNAVGDTFEYQLNQLKVVESE